MNGPGRPRAVLDSDVIYGRVLYELMGRVATSALLFDLVWSAELLAEIKRVLMERKPMTEAPAEKWVNYTRENFPNGEVDITRLPGAVDLTTMTSDPEDHHVCALAIAGQASYLFSFDTKFKKAGLATYGVELRRPDEFLSSEFDDQPELFLRLIEDQAAAWGGGKPVPELLDALERARVPVFASKVRTALDL